MARFTYSTDEEIIKEIKQMALDNGTSASIILDMSFRMFKLVNDTNNFNTTVGDLLMSTDDFARLYVTRNMKVE